MRQASVSAYWVRPLPTDRDFDSLCERMQAAAEVRALEVRGAY